MTSSIVWPAGFPTPLLNNGYGYKQPNLTQRSTFALGARVRQLYTDGADAFTASFVLSPPQWAYFQGWVRYTLNGGAQWFQLRLRAAGTLELREVRLVTTQPISYEVLAYGYVRVSLALETRIGTTMTKAYFDALGAFGDPGAVSADLQALESFVNG